MAWKTIHGMYGTSFYIRWRAIQTRCKNPNHKAYHRYGGRGIKCLWKSFEEFKNDMYDSYLIHLKEHGKNFTQLDRIDNNSNYCKENCRWVTPKINTNNSLSSKLITYKGKTMCIRDWGRQLGLSKNAVHQRIKKGWPIMKAVSTPKLNGHGKLYL